MDVIAANRYALIMKRKSVLSLLVLLCSLHALAAARISIVPADDPSPVAQTAAEELSLFLGQLHEGDSFPIVSQAPANGKQIRLAASLEQAVALGLPVEDFEQPGAFRVAAEADRGIIAAASPKALLDAVYTLLEQVHGQGFYLSENASASARKGAFTFEGWDLHDWPLIEERSIMAWPNFLSGVSTWTREEWLHWVRQAARMRATHLLYHTYANNPLLYLELDGYERPVGWMNSTRKGRTYAVEHIWDVRNIPGAEGLYEEAWFGSEAAKVPDEERVQASRDLMAAVFAEAHKYGLKNVWAIDVDTYEAHPQEMIESVLNEDEYFTAKARNWKLIKPDTQGGYRWHKTLMQELTETMPDIDRLIVWVRAYTMSPVMAMTPDQLPSDWQADLTARVGELPEIKNMGNYNPAGIYYASKVADAWEQALAELDHDIEVGFGSWTWQDDKFVTAHRLFPEDAPFYQKDYGNSISRGRSVFSDIETDRHVVPIAYVHHDDGHQCGPPLKLPKDLLGNLQNMNATGHSGVIWLTRPLDIYFRSAWDRLWYSGRDRTHEDACERMAADFVGPAAQEPFADFLEEWTAKGITFGRETSDQFGPIKRGDDVIENRDDKAGQKMERLVERVEKSQSKTRPLLQEASALADSEDAQAHIRYFNEYLDWVKLYFEAQLARANADQNVLLQRPEEKAIRAFSQAALAYEPTAGERGQVASLAARWQTFFVQQRQHLGLEPIRLRCMPTNHDFNARKRGEQTFHYDTQGGTWRVLGQEETKHEAVLDAASTGNAITDAWIQSENTLTLDLQDVRGETELPGGTYQVSVYLPDPIDGAAKNLILAVGEMEQTVAWNDAMTVNFDQKLVVADKSEMQLTVKTPDGGKVALSGVILDSVQP